MLFCTVAGYPTPIISWYRNYENIDRNDEYVLTYDSRTGRAYLVILDCLPDDAGLFQCIAANSAGQTVTQCQLVVLPSDSKDHVSRTSTRQCKTEQVSSSVVGKVKAPARTGSKQKVSKDIYNSCQEISEQSTLQSVLLSPALPSGLSRSQQIDYSRTANGAGQQNGSSTRLSSCQVNLQRSSSVDVTTCRAGSLPAAYIYGSRTVQSNMSSNVHQTTSSVRLEPTNNATSAAFDASVNYADPSHETVRGTLPSAEWVNRLDRMQEPPRFLSPLSNQVVRDGDVAVFRVSFQGYPMPNITWYFKQKVINSEQDFVVRTDSQKGQSVLWIREVFPEDEGEFTCKAENECGSAVTQCHLTVRSKYRQYSCKWTYLDV